MNVGVNKNGIAWVEISSGKYVLTFHIDNETELNITLNDASLKDVERISVEDFFKEDISNN